jgi:glycine/D-amino acid oxidase-like deaminating enzyme
VSADTSYDAVVCGVGILGIAVADALSRARGVARVALVDDRPPLSLTSDKSTEAYRNFWPGPDDAMIAFMNRSIDLLDAWARESDDRFLLNRRGYLYASADPVQAGMLERDAERASMQGAGVLRVRATTASLSGYVASPKRGIQGVPDGADLLLGRETIGREFPWLAPDTCAVLHVRRAGWMSAQQLGVWLLEQAESRRVVRVAGRVVGIEQAAGAVAAVHVAQNAERFTLRAPLVVNAAGPMASDIAQMVGITLPLARQWHRKVAIEDVHCAVPRDTGLVIWTDPQQLTFTDDERAELLADPQMAPYAGWLPAGVHTRPDGYSAAQSLLLLWDLGVHADAAPHFDRAPDALFPEIVLRGMARAIPGLSRYVERVPPSYEDGGYYVRTPENRPLLGATRVPGFLLACGCSGYGVMAAPAAAEIVACAATGDVLPHYAGALALARYDDTAYVARLDSWGSDGQL